MPSPTRETTAGRIFNDLRNLARRQGRGTDELLVLYVLERWLYRASVSPYQDRFVLKGGLLLAALDVRRPTRDGDLLATMDSDEGMVVSCVREIASLDDDDGVVFGFDQMRAIAIREEDQYAGVRITMPAAIGKARVKLALDVNFGDPVTPGAVRISYPTVLGGDAFEVWAYPVETVLAEKVTTAIARGEANTRERDWADLWRLVDSHDLGADSVADALRRTAAYRGVQLKPLSACLGRLVELRASHYRTWRRRQGADAIAYPAELATVVDDVVAFADPLLAGVVGGLRWDSGSRGWRVSP